MKKVNVVIASILATGLIFSAASTFAEVTDNGGQSTLKQFIKVKSKQGEGVFVKVGVNDVRNSYELSFEELENLDNVSAKLDNLDSDVKDEVLDLLQQLNQPDANVVELKNADIVKNGKQTEMSLVKTINDDSSMRIEIEVSGDGVGQMKNRKLSKLIDGKKGKHCRKGAKNKSKKMMNGDHKDMTSFISRLIEKADLSEEQLAQIQSTLDAKS